MLRDVLRNFLSTLTEREFDAPLLALLAARNFHHVHFIHGVFEFGKDFVAQREDEGVLYQYAIQSKAGDIGMGEWRDIRPQLEESAYNSVAHPDFDVALPRVVVLVTTGRLKGGAPADAQQFKAHLADYPKPVEFEVWDEETLSDLLGNEPRLGLTGVRAHALDAAVASIREGTFGEPELERFTRRWTDDESAQDRPGAASVEAAVLANLLRETRRADLASLVALHLLRAAWARSISAATARDASRPGLACIALRLFGGYVDSLLTQLEPFIGDVRDMVRALFDEMAIVTYPAMTLRLGELAGVAARYSDDELGVDGLSERASRATLTLVEHQPGLARPVSDLYATSMLPPVTFALKHRPHLARSYLRRVAEWVQDRHNPESSGLGLASIDESADVVIERLLGGALESTSLDLRRSSIVATVLLELLMLCDDPDLYATVRKNVEALRIVPGLTAADERAAHWHRGGGAVRTHVRLTFPPSLPGTSPAATFVSPSIPVADALALAIVTRTRYDAKALPLLIC